MTRDDLRERVVKLFPWLAKVGPWDWAETDEGEPVVVVERHASYTGLDSGDVDVTAPVPNTTLVGVWRIDTENRYTLVGLMEDPIATAGAEQAKRN